MTSFCESFGSLKLSLISIADLIYNVSKEDSCQCRPGIPWEYHVRSYEVTRCQTNEQEDSS